MYNVRCVSPWYNRTGWLGVKHQLTYLRSSLSVVSVGSDERFVVKFMLSSSSDIFLHQNRGNKPAMYICGLTAGWTDKMGQFTGLFIEWLIYGFALFYFGN